MSDKAATAKALVTDDVGQSRFSNSETLYLLVDSRLSTNQYNKVRKAGQYADLAFFPSYRSLFEEKKRCYFLDNKKIVTESSA